MPRHLSSLHIDPNGSLTDVDGVRVGHHQRVGRGWRTGTTAIVVEQGATAGVDVRGGGPGTRETDLLDPQNLIQQVHAICLTGGSAYGLAAANGVMQWLEQRRVGFPVGADPSFVVPIVPAAVIFDLGRGGVFANRPDADFGWRAARNARRTAEANGAVGAGTGAIAGHLQGGVGSVSTVVRPPNMQVEIVVAALAVVNAAGSVIDRTSGLPWESTAHHLRRPSATDRAALDGAIEAALAAQAAAAAVARAATSPPEAMSSLNTTIGVVATSARLSKAECTKVASVAHDGMARAIRPVHSMFDGDTVFALATGEHELPEPTSTGFRTESSRPGVLNLILDAAAQCFAAACTQALVTGTWRGGPPAFADLCPSAFASRRGAT